MPAQYSGPFDLEAFLRHPDHAADGIEEPPTRRDLEADAGIDAQIRRRSHRALAPGSPGAGSARLLHVLTRPAPLHR